MTAQPEVYEFLPDWRSTKEQRIKWLKSDEIPDNNAFLVLIPNITNAGCLKLAVILKETGECIGFCHTCLKEDLPYPHREIAYAISTAYKNNGYITNTVKGLATFLFTQTTINTLQIIAVERNVASNRVSIKSGFTYKGYVTIDGELHRHYVLRKEDWEVGRGPVSNNN